MTATNPVQLIRTVRHVDARGWFSEVYSPAGLEKHGICCKFVQENHSLSRQMHTLRGLHFQLPPHAQDKLVRCVRGRVFDVAVDLRQGSPTYGHWVSAELSADNGHQLFIPVGFAHGFLTLEPDCELVYMCSDTYAPDRDAGIGWNSLDINWPVPEGADPHMSDKDRSLTPFGDVCSQFTYDGRPLEPLI